MYACYHTDTPTQPTGPAYGHEFTMPMRTMSCTQSQTDKPLGSRASAPEPSSVQRSPVGPSGHWGEPGKGIGRCQSDMLPSRPPSSSRVLTAFLDEMTQDLEGADVSCESAKVTAAAAYSVSLMFYEYLLG